MNRECTQHDGGSIRKFYKGGEVNSLLPDLHHRPLDLVLVILIGTLPLIRFPGPRTISDEVIRTSAIETTISAASLLDLLNIWPWARLLWLLRRYGRSIPSLLWRRSENQSAKQSIPLWRSRRCIMNKSIPRGLNTRASSGNPSFLFGTVCHDAILLGQGHVNQLTKGIGLHKVQTFFELSAQAPTKMILFLGVTVSVITRVLTQVIKSLCILQYGASALGECQELIQFLFHQSFGYMVCSESIPKFFPADNMAIRLHGTIVIPPDTGSTT
jgi:hypothetical protein